MIFPASRPESRDARSLGQTVGAGRLELCRLLGKGSMGTVFRALDRDTDELVAVKVPHVSCASRREQIEREFGALNRVKHDNIVAAKAAFLDDEVPCFSMEWIDGQPFDTWVRPQGRLAADRLRSALRQIAAAVSALHGSGMVHCDLKPSNVLVTADGRAVLLDFGLVTDTLPARAVSSFEAEVYGTPAYMAPEQAAGRQPRQASDTYALGVMLYQALTGALPFEGSLSAILWARQRDLPVPPGTLQAGLPDDLAALCLELMAIDPDARPSDAQLLARLA